VFFFLQFAKYCEPILFLSGLAIDIVKTDSEGHARRYIEGLQQLPDALIIAGGDGTLSEAITGLMRRNTSEVCPVLIVPVGRTNSVANKMFLGSMSSNLEEAKGITNAAMSIVRGKLENKDVMKIEIIPSADETVPLKPVYAVGSLQWGAFRDILAKRDKYW
jgi:acylglycerol kinase